MVMIMSMNKVLANNWREAGVHSRTSPGYPDYPLVMILIVFFSCTVITINVI